MYVVRMFNRSTYIFKTMFGATVIFIRLIKRRITINYVSVFVYNFISHLSNVIFNSFNTIIFFIIVVQKSTPRPFCFLHKMHT
ncbi:hypothetical protein PUN28_001976 [Cardiocondyla obscurior]|uniref:Uncharacterized protein n=1 Tax=Cardiocondyla obscurior TaxID=286306 RepID=A0AAW2GS46_9HYME